MEDRGHHDDVTCVQNMFARGMGRQLASVILQVSLAREKIEPAHGREGTDTECVLAASRKERERGSEGGREGGGREGGKEGGREGGREEGGRERGSEGGREEGREEGGGEGGRGGLTTYSSEKPWSVSGSPVVGSQSFTSNFRVFRNVPVTVKKNYTLYYSLPPSLPPHLFRPHPSLPPSFPLLLPYLLMHLPSPPACK